VISGGLASCWAANPQCHRRPGVGLGRVHTRPLGVSPRVRVGCPMQSSVVKRSVLIGKHKTSISLEDEFWTGLKEIAASRQTTCSGLLSEINERREASNLSSAIRLFVLQHYQERAQAAVATPLVPD
jgi:predicted DNA-binding ribbon-helix-helix protein